MNTRASNKANKSKGSQEMAEGHPSTAGFNQEDTNTMQADSLQRLDEVCPGGDQDRDVSVRDPAAGGRQRGGVVSATNGTRSGVVSGIGAVGEAQPKAGGIIIRDIDSSEEEGEQSR